MKLFELFGTITLKDNKVDKKIDKLDKKAGKLGDKFKKVGKVVGAAGFAMAGALGAAAIKGVKSADELNSALNDFQASTGATADEVDGLKKSMLDIYSQNYGEDFRDIADSMSEVRRTTGQTGEELKNTTQNALMLRDTFEFEVNESVNTANSLMEQFGISSDEAFTLIAQGAQQGANKNGDLLDVLNEYAPQFKSLGFSAEEFTDTLIQGAESGAFSIDKVGDAVKEFNIRSKDMSDTSAEAFETLGFNAEEMFERFSEGGETANNAFEDVMDALEDMEDPLEKNQAGVKLFGTMYEDLEEGGIKALRNLADYTDKSADTLDKINNVKYDSFGEAVQGIGRQLETNFLIPIGQKVLPLLNDFANWINTQMPVIKSTISTVTNGIKTGFTTAYNVVSPLIESLKNIFSGLDLKFTGTGKKASELFASLKETFTSIFKVLSTVIGDIIDTIKDWVKNNEDSLKKLGKLFESAFKSIVKALNSFIKLFMKFWNEYGENIKEMISKALDLIVEIFGTSFKIIKKTFDAFSKLFSGDWKGFFVGIKDLVGTIFNGIVGIFKKSFGLLKTVAKNQLNFIKDIFMNIFGGIKDGILGIWDGIVAGIKGSINKIIEGMNFMIKGMNKVSFSTPDWLPGEPKSFGINIPRIPMLEKGGLVNKATMAMIGEGQDEEAVLPLNKKTYKEIADGINGQGGSPNITMNISLEGANIRNKDDIDYLTQQFYLKQKRAMREVGRRATT